MENHERFCLDNLLEYSPSKWLAERNPVVVKFLEILTYNQNEYQHKGEKFFKCAIAVDIKDVLLNYFCKKSNFGM